MKLALIGLLAINLLAAVASATRPLADDSTASQQRVTSDSAHARSHSLPSAVAPSHYDLDLTLDFDAFNFSGRAIIDLRVHEPIDTITFNAVALSLGSIRLEQAVSDDPSQASEVPIVNAIETAKLEQVTLHLARNLTAAAPARLTVEYAGLIGKKMSGMYRSHYTDPEGAKRDLTALSNTHVEAARSHPDIPGYTTTAFSPTPSMSTYIVAMAVGPFEYLEATLAPSLPHVPRPIAVRAYTPIGMRDRAQFALDTTLRSLPRLAAAFGTAYPLEKLDLLAVPDFDFSAMENWGLLAFRTSKLLVGPGFGTKKSVAYTVCHELAHQWFGNLVTMSWWDDLWLNEGFATWISYWMTDQLFPSWDVWTSFTADTVDSALVSDSYASTHPVQSAVVSPADIAQVFDAVTYNKGAALIRMIHGHLGPRVFFDRLRAYIREHSYGAAITADLFRALGGDELELAETMGPWLHRSGFPVVAARRTRGGAVQIARLGSLPEASTEEPDWTWIPVAVASDTSRATTSTTLSGSDDAATVAIAPSSHHFIANPASASYLRVAYSPRDLAALTTALARGPRRTSPLANPATRAALINDAMALAELGVYSSHQLVSLLAAAVQRETHPAVITAVHDHLGDLARAFPSTRGAPARLAAQLLMPWVAKELEPRHAHRFPAPRPRNGVKPITPLAAVTLLANDHGGGAWHPALVPWARRHVARRGAGNVRRRHLAYTVLARYGDAADRRLLWTRLRRINGTADTDMLVLTLALAGSPSTRSRLAILHHSLSDAVRPQDFARVVRTVVTSSSPHTVRAVWRAVHAAWPALERRMAGSMSVLSSVVGALDGAADARIAGEIEAFFAGRRRANPAAAAWIGRAVKSTVERVRRRAAWREREEEGMARAWREVVGDGEE
ncbi:hypothetical protein H9P43_003953 [Blastocladiella emersonii ATCC 22665]|nr:hypothetical protein H9P43_003953 [Blastocladiella emersonii ATCC 22665]